MSDQTPLEKLHVADPEICRRVKERIARLPVPASTEAIALLVEETIQGLTQETGFGEAIAEGMIYLISHAGIDALRAYAASVRQAAQTGATFGRIVAAHLPAVLAENGTLAQAFRHTIAIMRRKGTYTLKTPLELLSRLIAQGRKEAAAAYLDLLAATFAQDLSYNQSLRLVYLVPKAVAGMDSRRCLYQMLQLERVVATAIQLVDPFLDGMAKGLRLLSQAALAQFVDTALAAYQRNPDSGREYLSLSSSAAKQACAALQVAVPLSQVKGRLSRYLTARLGRGLPLQAIPVENTQHAEPYDSSIYSDGRSVFLTEEMDYFQRRCENEDLYHNLLRLEAGFFEFGSFNFDIERAVDRYPAVKEHLGRRQMRLSDRCDAERFIHLFSEPDLADDLLTVYEHARVMQLTEQHYPGIYRQVLPQLLGEADRRYARSFSPVEALYTRLVLRHAMTPGGSALFRDTVQTVVQLFADGVDAAATIETCADLVCRTYKLLRKYVVSSDGRYTPMATPFGRRFYWQRVSAALTVSLRAVSQVTRHLAEQGVRVYGGDLVALLGDGQHLDTERIRGLVLRAGTPPAQAATLDLSRLNLAAILKSAGLWISPPGKADGPVSHYNEWNCHLQDYLHKHTRVQEISVKPAAESIFYDGVRQHHRGAVARLRRAFELLKPQGLVLLRQWPEGDAFDYRALLDFAVARRAGLMPSDRLFIKRLKQVRDVAVLLLVDLSRSTANVVADGHATVLDVAKAALVLFCEALNVVGDTYAIAGFSGTGRHSVDYYCIKDFRHPLDRVVKGRIAALRPQRSTRMGAAVRHATTQLAGADARVRLLLMISDGFPNDLDYKSDYAIADTRRAVQEARSRGFHVKAITVNIGSDPRLDELYGRFHHHVIEDVRDLPDKLLKLYGTLTRY